MCRTNCTLSGGRYDYHDYVSCDLDSRVEWLHFLDDSNHSNLHDYLCDDEDNSGNEADDRNRVNHVFDYYIYADIS